jgi:hypothetical protein
MKKQTSSTVTFLIYGGQKKIFLGEYFGSTTIQAAKLPATPT